jgi:hypothetical protein
MKKKLPTGQRRRNLLNLRGFLESLFGTKAEIFSSLAFFCLHTSSQPESFSKPAKKEFALSIESEHTKRTFFFLVLGIVFCLEMDIRRRKFIGGTRENRKGFCAISK